MGMFDTIISSYDLGPSFHVCQTKSLHNSMSVYWLNPAGEMYNIDYDGTQDFEYAPEYDAAFWKDFKWVSNGTHGKVRPFPFYGMIEIYPEKWDAHWAAYPRLTLYMEHGTLKEYRVTTPHELRL